jgi:hypothetical protein
MHVFIMVACYDRLSRAPRTAFLLEVLPDIVRYIMYWKPKWEEWVLLDSVNDFCTAHDVVLEK